MVCSKMTHYINLVQTSKSGYTFPNLACKNIDFGGAGISRGATMRRNGVKPVLPAWVRHLAAADSARKSLSNGEAFSKTEETVHKADGLFCFLREKF